MSPQATATKSNSDVRFRVLIENSLDVIYIMNPKYQVSFVTPSVREVLGYTPHEFKALNIANIVHPDDLKSIEKTSKLFMANPGYEIGPLEQRIKHKNGSWRWMEIVGKNLINDPGMNGIYITSRDISERKKAVEAIDSRARALEQMSIEQDNTRKAILNLLEDFGDEQKTLAEAKAKDEAILESTGEGLIAVDNDRKIMVINKVAVDMLGWKVKDQMIGKVVATLPLEDEDGTPIPLNKQPAAQALVSGEITKAIYFLVRDDKTRFPMAITTTPIKLKGKTIGLIELIRDITKEREIDKAKTEFVSLASHQLRTPLSAVSWYAEMLLAGDAGVLNEEQKKYLDEVYRGNQRMTGLVDALLDVSRLELGTFVVDPEDIDINQVAISVADEQKNQIGDKKIKFSLTYEKDIPSLHTDPKFLRMVLQNLLSNALKYTPDAGTVKLDLRQVKRGGLVDNKQVNEDCVAVVVSDTGFGIPKAQTNKIFSKLFRADNVREKSTEGTGLGLYIVKSIVEHSGGAIWFDSEENKGTTFYVTLPLVGLKEEEEV